jgi:hypothetical protein
MSFWVLVVLACVFAGLAYDALDLAVPSKEVPFSVTGKELGVPMEHLPLVEQQRRKVWNDTQGLGDLSQAFWLWAILALTCALSALASFF